MAITIAEFRENPAAIRKSHGDVLCGYDDPINAHHSDNLMATLATDEWIEQAGKTVEAGGKCVGALSTVTGESILKIL